MVVSLPIVVKVAHHHTSQNTNKKYNKEVVHLNQNDIDFCEICLFSLALFNHSLEQTEDLLSLFINSYSIKKKYSFIFSSFTFSSTQLRAPPCLLS